MACGKISYTLLACFLMACVNNENSKEKFLISENDNQKTVFKEDFRSTSLDLSNLNIADTFNIEDYYEKWEMLDTLILTDNLISFIGNLPLNISYLDISNNNLEGSKRIEGLNNLTYLDISNNQIKSFGIKDSSPIQYIDISNNGMNTFFIVNKANLKYINVAGNHISVLRGFDNLDTHVCFHFNNMDFTCTQPCPPTENID